MKLEEIEIVSYKSISNEKIKIKENCIGLIGLNETGKTNILNAIRSLDPNFRFQINDTSKLTRSLPCVKFHFSFDEQDITYLSEHLYNQINKLTKNDTVSLIKNFHFKAITEIKYLHSDEEKKYKNYHDGVIDWEINIEDGFLYLNSPDSLPKEIKINIKEEEILLKSIKIIQSDLVSDEYIDAYVPLDSNSIKSVVEAELITQIQRYLPQVIFWEYEPRYILPAEITYKEFLENDDPYKKSAPLYNIFRICDELNIKNVDDLKDKVEQWSNDSSIRLRDKDIINAKINDYIKKIWEDYDQDLHIQLEEELITVHIKDPKSSQRNYYEMLLRSQGFQTFVSFMLTVAAEVESNILSNFILLLDEPETHLHPSGVRFMKKELIRLSEKANYVFFATHSIFMIDRNNLMRHLIVSKENELTMIEQVTSNNMIQEAVLYEALGTKLDEFSIPSKSIVFEGETDVLLFSYYVEECLNKRNNYILDYRFLDGGGVNKIERFLRDKVLPEQFDWILILDNDKPGRNLQQVIHEIYSPSTVDNFTVFFYSDTKNFELEDILPNNLIQSVIGTTLNNLDKRDLSIDLVESRNIKSQIEEFKNRNGFNEEEKKLFDKLFKEELKVNIEKKLKEIETKTSKQNKKKEFETLFEVYTRFIAQILDHFNISK